MARAEVGQALGAGTPLQPWSDILGHALQVLGEHVDDAPGRGFPARAAMIRWCASCGSGPHKTSALLCSSCAARCGVCRGEVEVSADMPRGTLLCHEHDKALQRAQLDRHPFYGPLYRDIEARRAEER